MIELHIPTEQYGFILVKGDFTPEKAKEVYEEYKRAFQPQEGLPRLEWNKLLEKYTTTGTMEQGEYDSLNEQQTWMIQELKKLSKRTNKE